ncbi:hypothetical protein [Rhodococcus sp. X156]|uniref:hypothetical protein n=1 Tax=Rhodococcus sp. X156 TaxID=2499145 RepID=UPI000FD8D4A1|nr:hypothetical protein [Rhodococcus sp. X156]
MTSQQSGRRQQWDELRPLAGWAAAVVVLLVVVLVLGASSDVRRAGTSGVGLGPASGEPVGEYLLRAESSLAGAGEADQARWGLVSLRAELTTAEAAALPGDARLAQAIFRVPVERVQTPQVTVSVVDQRDRAQELRALQNVAASELDTLARDETGREQAVDQLSAARLRSGCACVLSLLLRGTADQLRAVAQQPAVRAVEMTDADVTVQRVSVRALLPEQTEVAEPGPDDGDVPAP